MVRTLVFAVGLGFFVCGSTGCGPQIDLGHALTVTDVLSGWYDFGVVGGLNKLVPSVSFRLKNVGTAPIDEVDMTVSFWVEGSDGELDSKEVAGIGRQAVAPGAESDPILVRSDTGYTIEQPRAELFTHSQFKDATAKFFAKRGGKIVPIGTVKIDRRLLPHVDAPAGRP
jgi:hypothetical protein